MAMETKQNTTTRQCVSQNKKVVKTTHKVYKAIAKYHYKHGNSATSYKQLIKSKYRITCNGAASLTLQEAGILNKNEMIKHKRYGKMLGKKCINRVAKKGKYKVVYFKKKKTI